VLTATGRREKWRHALGAAGIFFSLLAVSLLLFVLADWLEKPGSTGSRRLLEWLTRLDGPAAIDRVASAAEVVAGVLGIAITVVMIVVQLAADRFTHRIPQLFILEPINGFVISFFVLTTIMCLWISTTPGTIDPTMSILPHAGLVLCMAMVTICLLMLIPYFMFVFRFLTPVNVIAHIRKQAERSILANQAVVKPGARGGLLEAIEELEDIAHAARQRSDRNISMAAVDALGELLEDYLPMRAAMPDDWFEVDGSLLRDPDFVRMDRPALAAVREERTWLETKILRQYWAIFTASLGEERDIAASIALSTRRIGAKAVIDHVGLLRLCVRFFNSYLRQAINVNDQRTAYFVLQQYRILCEDVMRAGHHDVAVEIAGHMRYYGQLGFTMGQGFLLYVVAYDMSQLVETAVEQGYEEADALLDLFLDVDRDDEAKEQEERLRDVRRVQVQLATFFLVRGDEARARRIHADMKDERPERLALIRDELEHEDRALFWEITDRGVNFSYLPPERRTKLGEFFGWFGDRS
jgi:hypothetical protein